MTADIVHRVDAFPGVADDDLAPAEGDRTHAALGNVREGEGWLKLGIAHFAALLGYRNAHSTRDASPLVLNLCAALLECGARLLGSG
jgi:hypothetical protein